MQYKSFLINGKTVGIALSKDYDFNSTFINKIRSDNIINYKNRYVRIVDPSEILFGKKLKKFDGILFVKKSDAIIGLKTESFYKILDKVDYVLDVENLINSFGTS